MYIAHKNDDGWEQTVGEHCLKVAIYAREDGEKIGLSNTAYLAGLLHDMGKNTMESNVYQCLSSEEKKKQTQKVIHSLAGGRYIYEKYGKQSNNESVERFLAELISISIFNHHGLYDCVEPFGTETGKNIFLNKIMNEEYNYKESKSKTFEYIISKEEIDILYKEALKEIQPVYDRIQSLPVNKRNEKNFYFGLLARLVSSMVINADHKDTEEFMTQMQKTEKTANWKEFSSFFEKQIKTLKKDSELNSIRSEISDKCLEFAKNEDGIYKLNVPTGGGKTLSGLRFAFHHAKEKQKSRIFYIAPYNSILEQNSEVIRNVIPDKNSLLEHHCNVVEYENNNTDYKYMTENWSAPIVATSMLQFLNSLFLGKVGSVRRMRGLINSVIIIDEVQSLPIKCVTMFNLAMNFLNTVCGCTIVLCSATQPKLEADCVHKMLVFDSCEILDDYEKYVKKFKRTEIADCTKPDGYTYSELAFFIDEKLVESNSVLAVFNTKSEAFNVYQNVKNVIASKPDSENYFIVNLSTNMCPKHRENELNRLREELENGCGKKIICISTQLIEAGVDISFRCVVRAIAGLDSIIQAAGRCNRNAEIDIGKVYIVNPADENTSKLFTIQRGKEITKGLLALYKKIPAVFDNDIESLKSVNRFYHQYFEIIKTQFDYPTSNGKTEGKALYSLLSDNAAAVSKMNEKNFFNQAFKSAGKEFEVISTDAVSVLVPYEKGKEYIEEINSADGFIHLEKEIQKYCVNIFKSKANDLISDGTVVLNNKTGIYFLNQNYSDEYGYCGSESLMELLI